jgi:hypothetical protein
MGFLAQSKMFRAWSYDLFRCTDSCKILAPYDSLVWCIETRASCSPLLSNTLLIHESYYVKKEPKVVTWLSMTIDWFGLVIRFIWPLNYWWLQSVTQRLVFTVMVFIAPLGNVFQRRTFLCSWARVLQAGGHLTPASSFPTATSGLSRNRVVVVIHYIRGGKLYLRFWRFPGSARLSFWYR